MATISYEIFILDSNNNRKDIFMNVKELEEELEIVKKHKKKVMLELKNYSDIVDYTLVQKKSNKCYQYYYRDETKNLIYIKADDKQLAKRLAQKEYYEKLLANLYAQEKSIERFLCKYNGTYLKDSYEGLADGKKRLVHPIEKTDDEFITEWRNRYIGEQNSYDFSVSYTTNKGEEVRSKSEKILADLFAKYGVIYKYEPEITLYNGRKAYPDFALLNIRERKTYFWEHFGLASDESYSDKNLAKLAKYEKSGILLGDNLIVSVEAEGIGIDIKLVEEKIKRLLM